MKNIYIPENPQETEFLQNYTIDKYPHPAVTADMAVIRNDHKGNYWTLLVQRGNFPYRNKWAFPGGFLNPDEDLETCALRELREETSLPLTKLEPLGFLSAPGRDPRGWIISAGFVAIVDGPLEQMAGDDAHDAQWFKIIDPDSSSVSLQYQDITLNVEYQFLTRENGSRRYHVLQSDLAFDHATLLAMALDYTLQNEK